MSANYNQQQVQVQYNYGDPHSPELTPELTIVDRLSLGHVSVLILNGPSIRTASSCRNPQ